MASASSAPTPRSPVLVIDATASTPRSARIELSREARGRGWKVVELRAGDDYPEIDAVAAECAADVVAFAGADGSQSKATVVASGRELAYACVPSGVDDLFARDLGIDPDDRLRALVAIEDYCEYYVDLAEVNGRTFVNYAALGLQCSKVRPSAPRERDAWAFSSLASYTAAWQEPTVPLHWLADSRRESCAALFISNNRRRFESHTVGRRTRLDGGVLGVGVLRSGHADSSVLDRGGSWLELGRAHFEVDSTVPLTVEVDGEAVLLDPPIRFRILPRALRVRIPPAR
jgi:diacylglycerol kinase family enzyme